MSKIKSNIFIKKTLNTKKINIYIFIYNKNFQFIK